MQFASQLLFITFAAATEPAAPPATEPALARVTLPVRVVGGLSGDLARITCASGAPEAPQLHFARQVALLSRPVGPEELPALGLDSGDTIFPGPAGHYLLWRGEGGADQLVKLLALAPLAGRAVGNHDLEPPPAEFLNYFRAARRAGLSLHAANVSCAPGAAAGALCEAVGTAGGKPFALERRGPLRVAVTAVTDPDLAKLVGPTHLDGLTLAPPAEVLAALVPKMRAAGADLVVVQLHATGDVSAKALALATAVDGIDLLVTSGALLAPTGEATEVAQGYAVAPRTGTLVVGSETGHRHVQELGLLVERAPEGPWRLTSLSARLVRTDGVAPEPAAAALLEAVAKDYCRDWGSALGEAPLAQPFTEADLHRYLLNVMRVETRSEVALVNRGAFPRASRGTDHFPLTGRLTRADIFTALPFGSQLAVVKLKGAVLLGLGDRLKAGTLVAAGLAVDDKGKLTVNGRPLDKTRTYQVAVNQFLAEGGDGVLAAQPPGAADEERPLIADLVTRFVEGGRFARGGQERERLSPDGNFPDLQDHFLWSFTGSVNAAYNHVGVTNPLQEGAPAYPQSQLALVPTDQATGELKALLRADARHHSWESDLLVQYAVTRLDPGGFEESRDLIRLRSAYKFRGLNALTGARWWTPVPFAEGQLETEFNAPGDRGWHRLELTSIAGASLKLFAPLEVKAGLNVRRDMLRPGADTTWGLTAGLRLLRTDLFSVLSRPVQLEAELEYFYNSIGAGTLHEVRNAERLFFALWDRLFFSLTFTLFVYRTSEVGLPGTSTQLTVGLNFLWDAVVQSF